MDAKGVFFKREASTSFAIGMASISLVAANVTFPITGRTDIPISVFCAGAGNLTAKGLDGYWFTKAVAANETVPVAVTEIAGNATTTATGIQVYY